MPTYYDHPEATPVQVELARSTRNEDFDFGWAVKLGQAGSYDSHRIIASLGHVGEDLVAAPQGTGQANAGETVYGAPRTLTGTSQDVVVIACASGKGRLGLDQSTDGGVTWKDASLNHDTPGADSVGAPMAAGNTYSMRFKPDSNANRYRLKFTADEAASKVSITSQLRVPRGLPGYA